MNCDHNELMIKLLISDVIKSITSKYICSNTSLDFGGVDDIMNNAGIIHSDNVIKSTIATIVLIVTSSWLQC